MAAVLRVTPSCFQLSEDPRLPSILTLENDHAWPVYFELQLDTYAIEFRPDSGVVPPGGKVLVKAYHSKSAQPLGLQQQVSLQTARNPIKRNSEPPDRPDQRTTNHFNYERNISKPDRNFESGRNKTDINDDSCLKLSFDSWSPEFLKDFPDLKPMYTSAMKKSLKKPQVASKVEVDLALEQHGTKVGLESTRVRAEVKARMKVTDKKSYQIYRGNFDIPESINKNSTLQPDNQNRVYNNDRFKAQTEESTLDRMNNNHGLFGNFQTRTAKTTNEHSTNKSLVQNSDVGHRRQGKKGVHGLKISCSCEDCLRLKSSNISSRDSSISRPANAKTVLTNSSYSSSSDSDQSSSLSKYRTSNLPYQMKKSYGCPTKSISTWILLGLILFFLLILIALVVFIVVRLEKDKKADKSRSLDWMLDNFCLNFED